MTTHPTANQPLSGSANHELPTPTSPERLPLRLKDYFHPDGGDIDYFAWAADRLQFGVRM